MDNNRVQNNDQFMSDEELKRHLENMSGDDVMDIMMKSLMIEKGITGLDPETEADCISQMKTRAIELINYSIIDALPDSLIGEMNRRIEKGEDAEKVFAEMVAKSGIDTEAITGEALNKFTSLYLGNDVD